MFNKRKMKQKIERYRKDILAIENKRNRSQAALVEAILTHSDPDDADVDYFNKYTDEINTLRDAKQRLEQEFEARYGKKRS